MNISKKAMAVGLCAALGSATLVVPSAGAVATVQEKNNMKTVQVKRDAGQWDPYITGETGPNHKGDFTYFNPEAWVDALKFSLQPEVKVGGEVVPTDWTAEPVISSDGEFDTIRYSQKYKGVTVQSRYIVRGDSVDLAVVAFNGSAAPTNVEINIANNLGDVSGAQAKMSGQGYEIEPAENGYTTNVNFYGQAVRGIGASKAEALASGANLTEPAFQGATWKQTLQQNSQLTAQAAVQVKTQLTAMDQDRDGLRDSWEANGLTLRDGTPLPIHQWGANQKEADLYLQLNWMKSEWETMKCDRTNPFDATVEGFTKFAECAMANTKDYGPSPRILKDLEKTFAREGINLHIDAGPGYVSPTMTGYKNPKGGKTEDFKESYFTDDSSEAAQLFDIMKKKLNGREAVFRVGVIGDQMKPTNYSTGIGITNGSAFYVANHAGMTTQDQLRNTIMHEFGHTLNLGHNGPHVPGRTAPNDSSLKEYKSVMSYAHQLTYDDYMKDDLSTPNFFIPSDWNNLNYPGMFIGKGSITVGAKEETQELAGECLDKHGCTNPEPPIEELILDAAKVNNGVASFRLKQTEDGTNGIVSRLGGQNLVEAEVRNLGATTDTFTVQVDYGAGTYKETKKLTPANAASSRWQLEIPIEQAALIDKPVVPLNVTVTNSAGKQVFQDTFRLSALNYSEAEMERVLSEIRKSSADPKIKAFAEQKLKVQPKPVQSSTAKPAPAPAAPSQQSQAPAPKDEGSSASPIAIVLGVLLALGGIGAAAFGWAKSQGMI